ncbi:hypothetical protein ABRG53_0994 [Pseudanabaena sp. ABRG5-3]|nr:hypothetical protein ABRG53_0994 [Pseudanabaena sp. ABRG5-3]
MDVEISKKNSNRFMSTPVTIDDIYKLFQASQQEYDRRAAEADRSMAELKKQ